jgi:hypothetical protein
LFEVCNEQKESAAKVARRGWRLTFRRWLDEIAQNQLRHLRDVLTTCGLGQEKDKPIWIWENTKGFLSKPCMPTFAELIQKTTIKNLEC